MATDENINKLQRKRSTLRSKVTRLTGKLNNEDGIDKAFDVELLEDTLQDLKLMNEAIHDLLTTRITSGILLIVKNILIPPSWRFLILSGRRLQALNALGENTEAYGRILAPQIIRAFPTEICCRWIIYAKREKLAEGNITRLMQFLAEEVEGSVEAQKIRAFESNNSYTTHSAATLEISQFAHKNKLKLTDPPDNSSLPIELLIGGNNYWQIVTAESPIKLSDSFVMVPSILSKFHKDYKTDDNRRIVSLTWKSIVTPLSPNIVNVKNRFHSVQKRLSSSNVLKTQYYKCMLNNIEQKQIEVCSTEESNEKQMHYLPHHAVKKVTQTETKWRIVFDASSHDPEMPSLNDTLEAGPNLLPEIVGCLLRFQKHEFAVTCDGKQAFLQLILHEKDRDFTRFLWYKLEFDSSGTPYFTDEIAVYRFSRLPFGLTCSSFLLCASTRELAMRHISEFPIAASMIDKHLYMDDFFASTETETHITMLYHEIKDLMTLMKLPMEKWATNSLKLKDVIQTNKEFHKSTTAVLGIDWDTNDDTLGNAFKTSFCVAGGKPLTKRWLLRCIDSCYDPLGLFSPFTIIGKILFQDTWILGIKWDELLPTNLSTMWYAAVKQLDDICSIKISRYIGITSHTPYSVHEFCDANGRAYGSVLYIVSSQSNVHIVCSRNRLAPIKKVTLPRLELLAALMGTRLLKYFCEEVDIQPSAATLWTDSKITLTQWRYCPGTQNPADHLSRGIFPSKLSNLKNWWYGPDWLTQEPSLWPTEDLSSYEQLKTDNEVRKPLTQSFYVETTNPVIDITHYSSYTKLLRVIAWILRFLHNCRNEQSFLFELTAEELQKAKDYWILNVQQQCFHVEMEALKNNRPSPTTSKIARFNPFLKNNQIRLGGRLQFVPLSTDVRHPLLLEGNHPFVLLLIKNTHVRLHHLGTRIVLSELRSDFWILRGRQAIKK
ncbi:integrase catalytic domain-containing protein, partial [Nephila pilipes]